MFSNALKSFSSNITSNYTISPQPCSSAGPWKIFDAKRKNSGKATSVFVFDKKSLDPSSSGSFGGKTNSSSLKRAQEEVVERLKREASNLARLRHPSILELAEPVEDTRNGGLMFATEPVTASLASLLLEKDEQERSGGVGGRGSKYMVEDQDGTRRRRELEIDELEIQKGLLQLGKGLEFLHESAGLVHANLTPEAVLVNAKGDWKIAGLGFCGPHENSTAATSLVPISLHEVLNHDPRLPRNVQLNLDFTSPDFVLDNTLIGAADMFSLGLLIIALYNSPHTSPLSVGGSLSTYKRTFSSSSTVPTQSNNFLVPSKSPIPPRLASELLPRLITRRPAQRFTARDFQDASYFDNILVSTLRFLESLPAKTPSEKAAFMRGLKGIMPQFPPSVLEKKILPALLEEMKDRELLGVILTDVFTMIKAMPTGKRAFTEKVVPRLREIFLTTRSNERDSAREAGLMIVLENMPVAAENCAGREFREDILPIILLSLESQTPGLVDAALSTLGSVLPVLDFSTIKNELFPVIAHCFSKTSSLAIKIKGLEAFYILCGGDSSKAEDGGGDGLDGIGVVEKKPTTSSSAILDKYTVQEKIVPLLKVIKTKEPGVMMAALRVFRQVGEVADSDFLALEALPILWSFSLGPLLNLQQFEAFMSLIKKIGTKIEREQTRKLREMSSGNAGFAAGIGKSGSAGLGGRQGTNGLGGGEEADFESLVSGRKATNATNNDLMNDWTAPAAVPRPDNSQTKSNLQPKDSPAFSWQTPLVMQPQSQRPGMGTLASQNLTARTITPDQSLSNFASLTPSNPWATPLQPQQQNITSTAPTSTSSFALRPSQPSSNGMASGAGIDWSTASMDNSSNVWSAQSTQGVAPMASTNNFGATSKNNSGYSLPPPPANQLGTQPQSGIGGLPGTIKPQNGNLQLGSGGGGGGNSQGQSNALDRYESLL